MNKANQIVPLLTAVAAVVVCACGGTIASDDGGVDAASKDSGGGFDSGPVNDAGCYSYVTNSCTGGCPTDTVCVTRDVGPGTASGCYPTGKCPGSISLCACIGSCACPSPGYTGCTENTGGVQCSGGPVSRRELKTDIAYVGDEEQKALADQALHTRLAEYRYKSEPEGDKKHLGFLIDDMPPESPAVQGDATHVDLYGYTSMLLATVKEQQKQIDALRKQVDELKAKRR